MTERLYTIDASEWGHEYSETGACAATHALETGRVLYLPRLSFTLDAREQRFLSPLCSDGMAKNISYDPSTQSIRHTAATGDERTALAHMMERYAEAARTLVTGLCPEYVRDLSWGLTSFRPVNAAGRETSARKDDTRLHIDAFASRPVHGKRILRVFCNVNPEGAPRVWNLGEPFDAVARRFAGRIPAQLPGSAWLYEKLRVTKGRRSAYDHLMLGLHDQSKLDENYQRSSDKTRVEFPSNTTWIVFTDMVMHAALAGQYLLEQTFYLPVAAMQDPARAPLSRLEAILQRTLV